MSVVDDNIVSNTSNNKTFEDVVEERFSRRNFLKGAAAAAALTSVSGSVGSLLAAVPAKANGGRPLLGFTAIPVSTADEVVVPDGYTARVLIRWGDPVSDGPAFQPDASNSAADQARQWGMHNDGVVYFPFYNDDDDDDNEGGRGSSRRGLLVQNSEYTDDVLLFTDGLVNWNADKTAKSLNAHGVNIIEVRRRGGEWQVVRPSRFARRITGQTPMKIGGPAAGDPRLQTSADPTGRRVLGTINNCAMGYTPWGTYLACEENFNGYFRTASTPATGTIEARYGLSRGGFGYLWHLTDKRFRTQQLNPADTTTVPAGQVMTNPTEFEPNEPNRFGWVVEIDPFSRNSTPVKRTALGRIKHEGAWVQEARDGRVVVYSGDDEQFEYIYRYVSNLPWRQARRRGINPLDDGILYVAKFNAEQIPGTDLSRGEWLPLTPDNPALAGWTLNDILINTRGAADLAGATPMDRPEWIDTFPESLTAIATLTNNSNRGVAGTNPRTGQPNPGVDASNPRARNTFGHVIRWIYRTDWTENTFGWDIFALGGDPDPNFPVPDDGSNIVGDKYGSPDGIYVAPSGRLWIQTDVSGSAINPENNPRTGAYATYGNNQMLCADPNTRETRRFLVGPNVCEITGVFVTPNEKTMFVGIQHPGEAPTGDNSPTNPKRFSNWPDGPTGGRPRSSCIVITKDDGGQIGS
ncbi:MAG: PhoX family protein [Blastocatellia bacterium]